MNVVAVAERMTDPLQAINHKLNINIKPIAEYRSNFTNKYFIDQVIDEKNNDMLEKCLAYDLRLYNRCVEILGNGSHGSPECCDFTFGFCARG